jgi:hypothetical protein
MYALVECNNNKKKEKEPNVQNAVRQRTLQNYSLIKLYTYYSK